MLVTVFSTFEKLLANTDIKIIVIDIPIGLTAKGPRPCDLEARRFIGIRGSSVFPAPVRSMLVAKDYREACGVRLRADGKKCSKQLWAITPKIREVDHCMSPSLQVRVYEGHPEVSFACIKGGCLIHSKHTPEGREQRVNLLESHFPAFKNRLSALSLMHAEEDIIDAFACLWTARRIQDDVARRFPIDKTLDDHGLRMEIIA
jgi:predicted RNase H-like nuclease